MVRFSTKRPGKHFRKFSKMPGGEVAMMTDPAFAIKNEVLQLVDVQIDTLRKPSSLTSFELDEYHSRSERITTL